MPSLIIELWLLVRTHRMLTLAERQYLRAAFEARDDLALADEFTASAKRYAARADWLRAEYETRRAAAHRFEGQAA